MSGITPIIDTLLHQVLGRRDLPVERPLPEQLIMPAQAGRAAQKAYSDSRLDPRPPPASGVRIGTRIKAETNAPSALRTTETPAPNVAATTRFSTAARAIADLLARFPSPPSAVRPATPLAANGQAINPAELAALLRASIESSGLFYESHLQRWRAGGFTRAQLAREPQMRATTATARAPVPDAAGTNAAQTTTPPGPSFTTAATLALAQNRDDHAVHAALDGVVRHQLEMLAAPVLRWEGIPWAGALMTMTLQPPPYHEEPGHPHDEQEPRPDGDNPWQSHLTLRLARLGEIQVNLALGAKHVALDMEAPPSALPRMQGASASLRSRVAALGFERVAVRVRARRAAAGAGHD